MTGKYVMAPLGKHFGFPFVSWMTQSAFVAEVGRLVLSSRQHSRWKTRLLAWKIDRFHRESADGCCAQARPYKRRLVGSSFPLGCSRGGNSLCRGIRKNTI